MKRKNELSLEDRLRAADPLANRAAPELSSELALKAMTAKNSSRQRPINLLVGTAFTLALVTTVALALPKQQQPLFSLSGSQAKSQTLSSPTHSIGTGSSGQSPMSSEAVAAPTIAESEQTLDELTSGVAGKMMLPYINYKYFAAEQLSAKAGRGQVYKLEFDGDAKQAAANFARFFGLKDSVELQFSDELSTSYLVGPKDYSSATVSVYTSPGSTGWNYNDPAGYVQPECVEKDESGCIRWEEIKAQPASLPTAAEVDKVIADLAKLSGWNSGDYRVYQSRNEWGVSASASLTLQDKPVAIELYLCWGQNGQLNYAGGQLGRLVSKGDFDTVSAKTAAPRANDWRWSASAHHSLYNYPQLPMTSMLKNAPEPACDTDCRPAEPVEPYQPITKNIELTSAKATPVLVYSQTGSIWVVPGYIYESEVGSIAVISLVEGVIELPKEANYDVLPLDEKPQLR